MCFIAQKEDEFKHEEEATKIVALYKNFEEGKKLQASRRRAQ